MKVWQPEQVRQSANHVMSASDQMPICTSLYIVIFDNTWVIQYVKCYNIMCDVMQYESQQVEWNGMNKWDKSKGEDDNKVDVRKSCMDNESREKQPSYP